MWYPPTPGKICGPTRQNLSLVMFSFVLCAALFAPSICSAEKILLTESATGARVFSVKAKLTVKGNLKTPQGDKNGFVGRC